MDQIFAQPQRKIIDEVVRESRSNIQDRVGEVFGVPNLEEAPQ